jgi:hypothetical protein
MKKENQLSNINLTPDMQRCEVKNPEIALLVNSTIDYKVLGIGLAKSIISMGKIREFKIAPNSNSVWMDVVDLTPNSDAHDWISVENWLEQLTSGLFEPLKPKQNDSTEPANLGKRPF